MKFNPPLLSVSAWILALVLAGCAANHPPTAQGLKPCCARASASKLRAHDAPGFASSASNCWVDVGSSWQDDRGKWRELSELKGKVQVVSMFFTACQGVCTLTLSDMQKIEASVGASSNEKVHFVMITLDPKRDGARQLRAYRSANSLPESRWTLLRGEPASTREMARFLGVGYGTDSSGRFVHASTIAILDQEGRLLARHDGLGSDLGGIVAEIKSATALGEKPISTAQAN